jgi:hypothetical protein
MMTMSDEQAMTAASARGEWLKGNLLGLGAGFGLHALIGYGLGSPAGFSLTSRELAVRVLGFMAAGACVALFQRRALRRIEPDLAGGAAVAVLRGAILCAAGFLLGFYLFGIPFDHFAGFAGVGLSAGLLMRGREAVRAQWAWTCALGFALAAFVAVFVAVPLYLLQIHEAGLTGHLALWLTNGVVGGVAAGLLTGPWLESLLRADALRAAGYNRHAALEAACN